MAKKLGKILYSLLKEKKIVGSYRASIYRWWNVS
jgi:hypothetical protein